MTPKEKAEELVNRYDNTIESSYSKAEKCALIAVDEIIEELEFINNFEDKDRVQYWKDVKQEIEKL